MHRYALFLCLVLVPLAAVGQDAEIAQARQYVELNARDFAAPAGSAEQARVTSAYFNRAARLTHVYLRQTINGVDVRGGDITVSVRPNGSIFHAAGEFFRDVAEARSMAPSLSADAAAHAVADHLGLPPTEPFHVVEAARGPAQASILNDGGVARQPVEASLLYEPTERGLRLAWDVTFHEPVDHHVWSVRVDALTGEILAQNDYVVHDHWGDARGNPVAFRGPETVRPFAEVAALADISASTQAETRPSANTGAAMSGAYRVFAEPLESPNHGDRTLVVNPHDTQASPYGWHDTEGTPAPNYTITRGNNVFAYVDANNTNQPNGTDAVPDGGIALTFDFPIDFSQAPSTYRLAAVTNLFYWNNVIHDVLWHYGFDEPAGNFQEMNYTGQGAGGDPVRAEAQDGGGMNNANFMTPVDGNPPRMQMYLWNTANPHIDGDFDNGVIAHEYAHGWSIRLTGGPMNVQCLWNQEQMGEGWSDYLGVILTMRPGDYAEQVRGIGTFVLNQPTNGPGIRPAPYSTSMSVNGYTYGNIGSLSVPHGVGFVWATMLWEMTWNLIDVHGWDADLVHGTGGNNIALRLVSEAMKLQPCSPGFVDGRDAILAADVALYEGANAPYIWEAFAKRGLGYSASQGSSGSSSDGTEAFDLPPGMDRTLTLTAEPAAVPSGEFLTYTIEFINGTARDPVDDMSLTTELPEGVIFAPGSTTGDVTYDPETGQVTFSVGDVDTGETAIRTFSVLADVEGGSNLLFEDDMDSGTDGWETAHGVGTVTWTQVANSGQGGSTAWYARNMPNPSDQYLWLEDEIEPTPGTVLSFRHRYDTEATWDGGVVEISIGGGAWQDLGEYMTANGYNDNLRPTATNNPLAGRPAFTGNSGSGWITTTVDLSSFAGQPVRIRFRLGTDSIVGYPTYDGWYVDHVLIIDEVSIALEACAESTGLHLPCDNLKSLVIDALEGTPEIVHDFEEMSFAVMNDEATTATLTFSNAGDRDLAAIAGVLGLPEFVTVTGGMLMVEPEGEQEIVIEIDPQGADPGEFTGELVLVTNDPDARLISVPMALYIGAVDTEGFASMPDGYLLESAHPNPFGQVAHVSLRVAEAQDVVIALYDVMGRQVLRLHDGELQAGSAHRFSIDGNGIASGVYILSVRGEHFSESQRITRVR